MGLFDFFKKPDPEAQARNEAARLRQADIIRALKTNAIPASMRKRIEGERSGALPWMATLTPAELLIARSHGIKPIAAVSATCWLHYGWSWTEGHAQGWETALRRLREEAKAAGANAVLDVKMRTVRLEVESSMDFTLVGTAVKVEGLDPSIDPVIATVPALEFVKLLEADIVPTGIAIGADYEWANEWNVGNYTFMGNMECGGLSSLLGQVRRRAHAQLRQSAKVQGGGVLAHINFNQVFRVENSQNGRYLARHIVIATTVDTPPLRNAIMPHDFRMVVDMHAHGTPLTGTIRHHQSYASNEEEGAI